MKYIFYKGLFFFILIKLISISPAYAQTLTIQNFVTGTYTPGSTIAVPFNIGAGGCVQQDNQFQLYLVDALGGSVLLNSSDGFYATYINGVIPAGTPAGTYTVIIKSTKPAVPSSPSATFTIANGAVVAAGINGVHLNNDPNVFGTCNQPSNNQYNFNSTSTPGPTSATFWNESTQSSEGTVNLAPNGTFTAQTTNYTIIAQASNGTSIGTQAYTLINNVINNTFGVSNNGVICLTTAGGGTLSYHVDTTTPNGIQNNFPGTIYSVKWGDGSSNIYTLCDIKALSGSISHTYTTSSCGQVANGQMNAFEIDIQPSSPYCLSAVPPVTSYARVLRSPTNDFTFLPAVGCTNSPVVFTNTSDPGQDPNSSANSCVNPNAKYTWYVDGVAIGIDYKVSETFTTIFTTRGSHTITLELENNGSSVCTGANVTKTICIEDPPKPMFTLPAAPVCSSTPVVPTDNSVVDAGCSNTNTYQWTVTGPAPVTYAGGTDATSHQPQFVFSQPGAYQVTLGISTTGCGVITSAPQAVYIDTPPTVTLSPDISLCGTNLTYSFSPDPGPTQTTITGTAQAQTSTYTWSVTGGTSSFAPGSTANDQYPKITFNQPVAYTVTVTVVNTCGTVTKSQQVTFEDAPTVTASASPTAICPGDLANLTGTISGGTGTNTPNWLGAGTFSSPGALTTTYQPTPAEISAGKATVIFDVTTSLTGQCADIRQNVTINIYPVNNITSATTKRICTGNPVNYNITSTVPGSTYTWTAALTSGTATGFTATGSGSPIIDVITNTDPVADAVITYTVIAHANGCDGPPFTLKVTVKAESTVVATPASGTICSGSPAGITLTPNIPTTTTYTWTSTVTGSITGNTQRATATATNAINDILTNNGTLPGTVTYIITPYNGSCPGSPETVTITVQPLPVTANPGPNDQQCNITAYTLNGNAPPFGTGLWTQTAGPTAVIVAPNDPHSAVTGLIPGNTYQFSWTITIPGCQNSSNPVIIRDDALTVGGITAGSVTVCGGSNSGAITLTGQVGSIIRWEYSIDNGTTWSSITNASTTLLYTNLTQTTQYRAVVQSGVCAVLFSTVSTIIVNQPTVVANAGTDQSLCNVTTAALNGNNPSPFVGTWTQTSGPAVAIANPSSYQTQVTGLTVGNTYKFTWTITGLPPCGDSQSTVTIYDAPDVVASFTTNQQDGCGAYTVNFTNTSSLINGINFVWDFGDGSPQSNLASPQHTFNPSPDGKDAIYTVSLKIVGNCVDRPAVTLPITVRPKTPIAAILPDKQSGCGSFALTVNNTSPGNNTRYDYYLYDGSTLVQTISTTDKSQVQFTAIVTTVIKTYELYMVATGYCNNKGESVHIPITVSPFDFAPGMFIKNNQVKGCAPVSVTFVNISSGGNVFYYNIYDGNQKLVDSFPGSTGEQNYTFTKSGVYYVAITATDDCGTLESAKTRVDVYDIPKPDFSVQTGFENGKVKSSFTNLTPDQPNEPASSLNYDWDYGDGSAIAHGFTPPDHLYDPAKSPYTVTMTATNPATGCSASVTKKNIIDRSILAGTLFLPNAFIPTSLHPELQTFKAKGFGIKEWQLRIFNNWGQLVWETTKLDSQGSPVDGWDGTFRGVPAQQGVYEWQGSATFLNGTEWKGMSFKNSLPKRIGYITLIR